MQSLSLNQQLVLDRHHLHNVRSAFLKLNQARLDVARDSLDDTQRLFIDVLPLLFHYNHPMLPGYVSRNTPSGLSNYRCSEEQVLQARRLTRSFQPNHDPNHAADILSLFTMGSFGTIAQTRKSDIDIWLCYRPGLNQQALDVLEKKCSSISVWARKQGLDVTIFLMNHQTFQSEKQRDFNRDASGTTQHYLLLDEFYRTAIHLGGLLPVWLFIQPQHRAHYQECRDLIVQQRLIPDSALIDFGEINRIPEDEFISSAIWQLYKAIDSPYKSILKLLLLEIYCQNVEQPKLLSGVFKEHLHGVDRHRLIHHWDVDPYLQNYYFIEDYLSTTQQNQRLEFLRRCFYFKLEEPLTKGRKVSPRSSILLEMTKMWGWDEAYLQHLDQHDHWPLKDVLEERRLIINELNHSYHLIMDFFRSQNISMHASNRELNILGRKLHAAFSRKAGKIEWVNPLSSKNIAESCLVLSKSTEALLWTATNNQQQLIAKKSNPVELIAWLHCNQVMVAATRLNFASDNMVANAMDSRLLQSLCRIISSLIPLPMKTASHEVFEKGCHLTQLLLFIDYRPDQPLDLSSDINDIDITQFDATIDSLSINSWNEIICESRQGPMLDSLLQQFLQALQHQQVSSRTDILLYHPDRYFQQQIRQAVKVLFGGIIAFFEANPSGRYISRINHRYLMIHIHEQHSRVEWLENDAELKVFLSTSMPYYSAIGFDEVTMAQHPLALFTREHSPGSINVFCRRRGQQADITLIDELGTWHESTLDCYPGQQSLQPLHRFLRSVNDRRYDRPLSEVGPFDIVPMHFFDVQKGNEGWQSRRLAISSQVDDQAGLAIYATLESCEQDDHDGELAHGEASSSRYCFSLFVDEVRFCEVNEADNAYKQLATVILNEQARQDSERDYYISDLDLSKCREQLTTTGELNTSHYMQVKTALEAKINRALYQ